MAQLLSPVCTDSLKFQNPVQCFSSRNKFSNNFNNVNWSSAGHSGRKRGFGRLKVTYQDSAAAEDIADDYYAVLGLLPDATPIQIKKAYYNCMKSCHPDLSGDDPETTNFCMFINEVYEILSDPVQRRVYDEIHGYTATAINPFLSDSSPKDHAFVDEFSCIGCKNCANVCPKVFGIEEDYGRARVFDQSGNIDLIQQAIDSCPVDCIHWTSAAQLSLLEDEMRRVERVNVAFMLSGMGHGAVDVFRMVFPNSALCFFCLVHCQYQPNHQWTTTTSATQSVRSQRWRLGGVVVRRRYPYLVEIERLLSKDPRLNN